jgi:hypothetical protein
MVSDDRKTKTSPAPKDEAVVKKAAPTKKKDESQPKDESTSGRDLSKAEGGASDSPSGYSRGEGQKPVSKAYKANWNAIYAKKNKR